MVLLATPVAAAQRVVVEQPPTAVAIRVTSQAQVSQLRLELSAIADEWTLGAGRVVSIAPNRGIPARLVGRAGVDKVSVHLGPVSAVAEVTGMVALDRPGSVVAAGVTIAHFNVDISADLSGLGHVEPSIAIRDARISAFDGVAGALAGASAASPGIIAVPAAPLSMDVSDPVLVVDPAGRRVHGTIKLRAPLSPGAFGEGRAVMTLYGPDASSIAVTLERIEWRQVEGRWFGAVDAAVHGGDIERVALRLGDTDTPFSAQVLGWRADPAGPSRAAAHLQP